MPFKDNFKPISISVEDGKDYSISITLGNGIMLGSSSFFNFQNERISGTSITNSPLGKGADIKGKEILVKSTFEADNDATQFVSINYGVSYNNTESRSMPKEDDKFFTFHTKIKFS